MKKLFLSTKITLPRPSWSSFWLVACAATVFVSPDATAATRSVELGGVQAEYSDQPGQFCVEEPRLKITREGQVAFDEVFTEEGLCRQDEDVFAIQDLDGDGEPEVIVDFYSGGAHCCSSSFIFRYDPESEQYTSIQHLWGEGQGASRRPDLDGDGTPEFIHYDSRFAYAFTGYAQSGMPIRIWQYRNGEMINVTRNYPKQIYDDAFKWWQLYTQYKQQGSDVKGILAAYLADKYLLGEMEDGWQRLEQVYQEDDRQQFFTKLREFLVETGYVAQTPPRRDPLIRRPTDPAPTPLPLPELEQPTESVVLEEQNALAPGDAVLQIDQTLYDEYTFRGQAGEQIVITLESTEFDSYLILVDPNQTIIAENDDVTASSQDSQITITLPQNGIYTVVANAYQEEGQGEYTLIVRSSGTLEQSSPNTQTTSESTSGETNNSTNASEFGTIEGTLSYPSETIPVLTVCAQSTQNYYLLSCMETAAGQRTFKMMLRPGEYYIFSYRAGTNSQNATSNAQNNAQDTFIYYTRSEATNDPLPVRVVAGNTLSNISPKNPSACTGTPKPAYCVKPPS